MQQLLWLLDWTELVVDPLDNVLDGLLDTLLLDALQVLHGWHGGYKVVDGLHLLEELAWVLFELFVFRSFEC